MPRVAGRRRGRDLSRLPHAEAAHGRCGSRRDDGPLHSAAAGARSAGAARPRRTARAGDYRGEVVLYYPPTLPPTPENELYLALAQVQQELESRRPASPGSSSAIERHRPARPEFYYELARAYAKTANHDAVIRWCRGGASRATPRFVPALKELAAAATATGQARRSGAGARKGGRAPPGRCECARGSWQRVPAAGPCGSTREQALQRALALDADPAAGEQHDGAGGAAQEATRRGRDAIFARRSALQPDLAEAHNNLGNLLAGRQAYAEAASSF